MCILVLGKHSEDLAQKIALGVFGHVVGEHVDHVLKRRLAKREPRHVVSRVHFLHTNKHTALDTQVKRAAHHHHHSL